MTPGSNERMDRVEANLDRLAILLAQASERQNVSEHRIDKILAAIAVDG